MDFRSPCTLTTDHDSCPGAGRRAAELATPITVSLPNIIRKLIQFDPFHD